MNMQCLKTPDSLTFWWEKPELFLNGDSFILEIEGGEMKTLTKTHGTFENLRPGSSYEVSLKFLHAGACADETVMTVQTENERPVIDVTKAPYFAKGDGETMDRAAIQRAIDDCPAGGTVLLPEGIYRTGALTLKSDMELCLAEGAVLQGTDDPRDYEPRIMSRFEGTEGMAYQSLINIGVLNRAAGRPTKNVRIRGLGTIAGGGFSLMMNTIEREKALMAERNEANTFGSYGVETENTVPGRVRGRLINISCAENVRITGVTLRDGPAWNVHMIYSAHVTTDHITLISKHIWNGDGWDPDSSTDCALFASDFYTGDDAVAIKSGKNPEGNKIALPTERIRVFDCRVHYGHGFAIGSEMSGGVRDVKYWDCDLSGSFCGLEVKATRKRGGYVRDVSFRDCVAPRVQVHTVDYNDDGEGAATLPVLSGFHFENITLTGLAKNEETEEFEECLPVLLAGFPEEGHHLTDITFKNITLPEGRAETVKAEFVDW